MINTYFENIESEILNLIGNATFEIKIAVSWFTNNAIMISIINKLKNGVNVSIILNDDEINNNKNSIDFEEYISNRGELYFLDKKYFLHHKFLIVDGLIVQTGSYNYTKIAENINAENIIVIENSDVAIKFNEEFNKLRNFSIKINSFIRNDKINRIELPCEKIPATNCIVSYEEFVILEYQNYDIARLKSLSSDKIVEVYVSDLPAWYEEGDFLRIKTPYNFMFSIITNHNLYLGKKETSIIENPQIIT